MYEGERVCEKHDIRIANRYSILKVKEKEHVHTYLNQSTLIDVGILWTSFFFSKSACLFLFSSSYLQPDLSRWTSFSMNSVFLGRSSCALVNTNHVLSVGKRIIGTGNVLVLAIVSELLVYRFAFCRL